LPEKKNTKLVHNEYKNEEGRAVINHMYACVWVKVNVEGLKIE